jgi:integrase
VIKPDAMKDYIEHAGITSGPLFRPLRNSKVRELADSTMDEFTMYRVLMSYLERVPGSTRVTRAEDGSEQKECIYHPHSLRATTATLLLEAGVPIEEVQQLLGHKHITTTQIYDKRRRTTRQSASHQIPF